MSTATTTLQQSPGLNRMRQWWKRIPKTCCRKEILMLLAWLVLYMFSSDLLLNSSSLLDEFYPGYFFLASQLGSYFCAPFIGWLADVKIGRYKVILYGTLALIAASILFAVELLTGKVSGEVISCIGSIVQGISYACFTAAMLPFMTDQLIGATADELSSVVYWYWWVINLIEALASFIVCINSILSGLIIAVQCAACLTIIIISDCMCQQWLDKTHKVTNPTKLIIQVLNYARKNSCPQKRSAFTYMDEEQPSGRLDFGKEKFGGPFSEEEVENVKTVLQLLPLMVCNSMGVSCSWSKLDLNAFDSKYVQFNCVLNSGVRDWIAPLLLVPFCQFLIYPLFHKWIPSMLKRIGAGLFLQLVGFALCTALLIKGYTHTSSYLTCTAFNTSQASPNAFVEWYWKLAPQVIYSMGNAISHVLLLEFVIAQSPDKMKGLVFGMMLAFTGLGCGIGLILDVFFTYTLCYDLSVLTLLTVQFLVFLLLTKRYTLRERNKEVNIQAIVEEHYERYMDQEEEFMREQHSTDTLDSAVVDITDSTQ